MKKQILITGAGGEIGHGLIDHLSKNSNNAIVALDIRALDKKLVSSVTHSITADILDTKQLESLFEKYKFDTIFHLAAMLSTSAEHDPIKAHHVNTDGAINLLSLTERFSRKLNKQIVFMFPSSIAIYGLPDLKTAKVIGKIREEQWNLPATMYGCNKLYVELLGHYYERYFEKDIKTPRGLLDFRSIRFPGLLSADTLPTGGTSDFGPEMLHAAAEGKSYECFVREDSQIPFMAMPDAVRALISLSHANKIELTHDNYNVGSFSISAKEIATIAKRHFPKFSVTYKPHQKRQAIIDSWPEDVDDSLARKDWGWKAKYDKITTFEDYLVPAIIRRYS